jgi:hypothetical protein
MAATATPASVAEALQMLESSLGFLAATDATQMPAEEQARCLHSFERADAVETAARASILGGFTAGQGYCQDGDYSPRSWLIHRTRITRGAATAHVAWVRRARAHPRIIQALAAADMSESYARTICAWTGALPKDCQDAADAILVGAAQAGMELRELAALAAEIQSKARPDTPDDDPDRTFDDRAVRLETTFGGAGVLTGNLTPECAAVMTAVLDALSAPKGAEDDRSHEQRYHDALEEAMRRLIAAGLLPERAGQPVKVWAHISLADLIDLDAESELLKKWTARVRSQWAAHRAAASVGGSDGAAWLDGDAAEGFVCDASVSPVVFGDVNPAVLEDLVRLCVELAGHGPGRCHPNPNPETPEAQQPPEAQQAPETPQPSAAPSGSQAPPPPETPQASPVPPTARSHAALEREIIGKAVALLSGPAGLASYLRRHQLGARLAGPSLPLDIGFSDNVPASIRNAVKLRDKHCRWAGGCDQPASACDVHHVKHRACGGKTSLDQCILLCHFHHQVMIHRMGWTLVLHPDGTTSAWNPDRSKILHGTGPPARAG